MLLQKCTFIATIMTTIFITSTKSQETPSPEEIFATTTKPSQLLNDYPELTNPEIILNSESGLNVATAEKDFSQKHWSKFSKIPIDLFQKLHPANLIKPITDKLTKISEFFTHPNHPNYGGVQFLSPQQLWEKIHEKGHHFLTGANGAIFGFGNFENNDYPFAYRSGKSLKNNLKRKNFLLELLNGYKENKTQVLQFNLDSGDFIGGNKSYEFPYMLSKAAVRDFLKNITREMQN